MNPLARLIKAIDDNVSTVLDRHVSLAIPAQRSSTSPDSVAVLHLTPAGQRLEMVDVWPCCVCCTAYTPQPCPAIHRSPCDLDECGQSGGAA